MCQTMADPSDPALCVPHRTVNRVAIDVRKNAMTFLSDDGGVSFTCGEWGLYGRLYDVHLDGQDRAHWQPFNDIPPIIAYVNYRFYATHVFPGDTQRESLLKKILHEQMANGTDISADMRRSIDDQVAAVPQADITRLLAEQNRYDQMIDDRNACFGTKQEWLAVHGGPDWEGYIY